MRATTDAKGRLVISAEILAEAGLAADAPLEIRVRNGKVEIEAAPPAGEDVSASVPVSALTSATAAAASAGRHSGLSLVKGHASGGGSAAGTAGAGTRKEAERPNLDLLVRMAIAHRRLVDVVYEDRRKLVEPHDYGERNGEARLLVYQLSGESRTSSSASGWRELRLTLISDFRVLDDMFAGGRPADRHITWDRLYARVSPSAPDSEKRSD